ncbi:hypothetical protein MesoLjLc_32130 [Mesorhizobium sp. L-8-10]|uniref:hypothetical protein n=1 Tax=Mesorhizobium sp. L-8-10 TaxID=2744523 RepID=UPI0019282532|nr:hypothetical protein [Mesorhizobium sp. L-8-10]BCH31283.1 hypothetical protein MesoLjLc_32130 [Mesorhizobium sp. L-8-10]
MRSNGPALSGRITLSALGFSGDAAPELGVPAGEVVPPWIAIARAKIGQHEKIYNKKLRDWLKSDGHALGDPAKLPWCGDFVETCLALALPGNPYWARSTGASSGRAYVHSGLGIAAMLPTVPDNRSSDSPHYARARAREIGYHAMADEALEIGRGVSLSAITAQAGSERSTPAQRPPRPVLTPRLFKAAAIPLRLATP